MEALGFCYLLDSCCMMEPYVVEKNNGLGRE